MKKYYLSLIFTLLLLPSYSQVKVMTYNIWNGFDWGKDTVRKKEFISWVQSKQPDVLALQELCAYTNEKLSNDAKKWGHSYSVLLKEKGYSVGITSNQPIEIKGKYLDSLWHGMLHCKTYDIDFFVVHLSPADYNFRFKEAAFIKQKIDKSASKNFMILGDFNSHSPFDGDRLKNQSVLLENYSRKDPKSKYDNLNENRFDYSVISKFLSIPTVDVSQIYLDLSDRYTFPSRAILKPEDNQELIEERIDYILVGPQLSIKCTGVEIFNKDNNLSDHYPVQAIFDLR